MMNFFARLAGRFYKSGAFVTAAPGSEVSGRALNAAIAEACRAVPGKTAYIVWVSASWAWGSPEFDEFRMYPRMRRILRDTLLIKLDQDEWSDAMKDKESLYQWTVIPAFIEADKNGKPTGRSVHSGYWNDKDYEKLTEVFQGFFLEQKEYEEPPMFG